MKNVADGELQLQVLPTMVPTPSSFTAVSTARARREKRNSSASANITSCYTSCYAVGYGLAEASGSAALARLHCLIANVENAIQM